MQLSITFRHIESSEAVKEYAKEKLERIRKYFPDPIKGHVVFSLDEDGRLAETVEQIAQQLAVPIPLADEAVQVVRDLEPIGVGARDLDRKSVV